MQLTAVSLTFYLAPWNGGIQEYGEGTSYVAHLFRLCAVLYPTQEHREYDREVQQGWVLCDHVGAFLQRTLHRAALN